MEEQKLTFMDRIELGFNLVNHILISFIAIYMSYVCFNLNLKSTALHAWLCTIGFNLLMAEGIMAFSSGNFPIFNMGRKQKTIIHWVLQAVGGILGFVGGLLKIISKPSHHFTTIHSITGLIGMILTAISLLSGLSALFNTKVKRCVSPAINKTFHNMIGIAAFVIANVSLYYGYNTGFFTRKVEPNFADMMRAFTIITLILSCWGPIKALWFKIKSFI